jgi:hypothetical protein
LCFEVLPLLLLQVQLCSELSRRSPHSSQQHVCIDLLLLPLLLLLLQVPLCS